MLEFPWWAWIIVVFEVFLVVLLFVKWEEPIITGIKPKEGEDE